MMKRRRAGKLITEKARTRARKSDRRGVRPQNGMEYFAVWRSKDMLKQRKQMIENADFGGASTDFKTVQKPKDPGFNLQATPPLRRSSRLNPNNQPSFKKPEQIHPVNSEKRGETKSIFKDIIQKYHELVKAGSSDRCNQNVANCVNNRQVAVNSRFNDDLAVEARLHMLRNQREKISMNLENKLKEFNNILGGKGSPISSRSTLKRKQQEITENEMPMRLFTPSKYVYSTPENQKFRPHIPVEQSPTLVPAVYETSKKMKVLYDIDRNVTRHVNIDSFMRPGVQVPIDHHFLKPICTNIQDSDNQFLNTTFECTIDLNQQINSMPPIPISQNKENVSSIFPSYSIQKKEMDYSFLNRGSEDSLNFTFREIPNTSKYIPTISIEQEMAAKCTVRPAKVPRMAFHRTLSRKSLNFETSPAQSPRKHYYECQNFEYVPQPQQSFNFETGHLYDESMEPLQLNMNISLNDDGY